MIPLYLPDDMTDREIEAIALVTKCVVRPTHNAGIMLERLPECATPQNTIERAVEMLPPKKYLSTAPTQE